MDFKLIAIILMTAAFVWKLLLSYLGWRSGKNPVPENVKDVYNEEEYKKWREYHAALSKHSLFSACVVFALDIVLLLTDAYAAFASLFPASPYIQLLAVALLMAITVLATTPFNYYRTFKIEERFGFNRSTLKTFISDEIKGLVIEFVLTAALSALLCLLHSKLGDFVAVLFGAALIALILIINFLTPVLTKIFNKFTPLEEGELKEKLTALLEKNGYKVKSIDVMDASKRSTRINAYFAGFGKMKTIVLYDTMLEKLSADEICAVFAHEMGHGLHKDTLKLQTISMLMMAIIAGLAFVDVKYPDICRSFGFEGVNYGFALYLVMSIEMAVVAPLFSLVSNAASRRAEYRADAQAASEGYGSTLISALKVIGRENFADLAPDRLLVALQHSHPTLSDRIAKIEEASKRN